MNTYFIKRIFTGIILTFLPYFVAINLVSFLEAIHIYLFQFIFIIFMLVAMPIAGFIGVLLLQYSSWKKSFLVAAGFEAFLFVFQSITLMTIGRLGYFDVVFILFYIMFIGGAGALYLPNEFEDKHKKRFQSKRVIYTIVLLLFFSLACISPFQKYQRGQEFKRTCEGLQGKQFTMENIAPLHAKVRTYKDTSMGTLVPVTKEFVLKNSLPVLLYGKDSETDNGWTCRLDGINGYINATNAEFYSD